MNDESTLQNKKIEEPGISEQLASFIQDARSLRGDVERKPEVFGPLFIQTLRKGLQRALEADLLNEAEQIIAILEQVNLDSTQKEDAVSEFNEYITRRRNDLIEKLFQEIVAKNLTDNWEDIVEANRLAGNLRVIVPQDHSRYADMNALVSDVAQRYNKIKDTRDARQKSQDARIHDINTRLAEIDNSLSTLHQRSSQLSDTRVDEHVRQVYVSEKAKLCAEAVGLLSELKRLMSDESGLDNRIEGFIAQLEKTGNIGLNEVNERLKDTQNKRNELFSQAQAAYKAGDASQAMGILELLELEEQGDEYSQLRDNVNKAQDFQAWSMKLLSEQPDADNQIFGELNQWIAAKIPQNCWKKQSPVAYFQNQSIKIAEQLSEQRSLDMALAEKIIKNRQATRLVKEASGETNVATDTRVPDLRPVVIELQTLADGRYTDIEQATTFWQAIDCIPTRAVVEKISLESMKRQIDTEENDAKMVRELQGKNHELASQIAGDQEIISNYQSQLEEQKGIKTRENIHTRTLIYVGWGLLALVFVVSLVLGFSGQMTFGGREADGDVFVTTAPTQTSQVAIQEGTSSSGPTPTIATPTVTPIKPSATPGQTPTETITPVPTPTSSIPQSNQIPADIDNELKNTYGVLPVMQVDVANANFSPNKDATVGKGWQSKYKGTDDAHFVSIYMMPDVKPETFTAEWKFSTPITDNGLYEIFVNDIANAAGDAQDGVTYQYHLMTSNQTQNRLLGSSEYVPLIKSEQQSDKLRSIGIYSLEKDQVISILLTVKVQPGITYPSVAVDNVILARVNQIDPEKYPILKRAELTDKPIFSIVDDSQALKVPVDQWTTDTSNDFNIDGFSKVTIAPPSPDQTYKVTWDFPHPLIGPGKYEVMVYIPTFEESQDVTIAPMKYQVLVDGQEEPVIEIDSQNDGTKGTWVRLFTVELAAGEEKKLQVIMEPGTGAAPGTELLADAVLVAIIK